VEAAKAGDLDACGNPDLFEQDEPVDYIHVSSFSIVLNNLRITEYLHLGKSRNDDDPFALPTFTADIDVSRSMFRIFSGDTESIDVSFSKGSDIFIQAVDELSPLLDKDPPYALIEFYDRGEKSFSITLNLKIELVDRIRKAIKSEKLRELCLSGPLTSNAQDLGGPRFSKDFTVELIFG
jgi:hypothetical protein